MIAKAFQRAGYHVFPHDGPTRHYSQIVPRDFDLSPNFDIVKFAASGDSLVPSAGGIAGRVARV